MLILQVRNVTLKYCAEIYVDNYNSDNCFYLTKRVLSFATFSYFPFKDDVHYTVAAATKVRSKWSTPLPVKKGVYLSIIICLFVVVG
jgi:hypothetical protein